MAYQNMDHAKWVEDQNRALNRMAAKKRNWAPLPEQLTDFQARVMDIVGMVGCGIYNSPICSVDKIDWKYGFNGVSLTWHRDMATFDFDQLTRLVFLCHEARIRCSVEAVAPRLMRLSFWQRVASGDMAVRHSNLDEAVAAFREYLPLDHRIIFRPAEEPAEPAGPAPVEEVA